MALMPSRTISPALATVLHAAIRAALLQLPAEVNALVRRTVRRVEVTTAYAWHGTGSRVVKMACFTPDPVPLLVFQGPLVAQLPVEVLLPLTAHEAAHAVLWRRGEAWESEDLCNLLVEAWGIDVGPLLAWQPA
jgi:hypothetical protein